MSPNALCAEWIKLSDELITVYHVTHILGNISDEPWVVAASTERYVENVEVQRALLDLGLERSKSAAERSRKAMFSILAPVDEDEEDGKPVKSDVELQQESIASHFSIHATDELLCRLRAVLLTRLDKLETFIELSKQWSRETAVSTAYAENEWDDVDPWDENQDGDLKEDSISDNTPILSLSSFLRGNLVHTALLFASSLKLGSLGVLFDRHADILNSHRLYILQNIPEHTHPSEFRSLLPALELSMESVVIPSGRPWRDSLDWSEKEEVRAILPVNDEVRPSVQATAPSVSEVSQWYKGRISRADEAGFVDVALAMAQHGASQGVPELDELGEELNLLFRLVYDAPNIENDDFVDDNWTLSRWRSLEPMEVINAYLTYSTPDTVSDDIRRLVMPYLFTLESREERVGRMDSDIVNRFFYAYLLQAPLEFAASIFEASKPTLSTAQRLIKKDDDMVRLALACLYGSDSLADWSVKSRIFECLPDWGGVNDGEKDEADTTLLSLGTFVTPSTARSRCTPPELLVFFNPLTASALSRIVDVLDVHLESGEILEKWSVPAPLSWFLQSADKETEQRAWATRMSRRAGNEDNELESNDWLELLEDMLKLAGGGDGPLKGAFGLLGKEEVTKLFFSGLLSSGNFAVAKSVLRKTRNTYLSDHILVEEQILTSSREFYDNANSGNLYQGNMKLAYECLSVAPSTPAILQEKEFIEATSRICSFNVFSRHGIPISPIEIRLTKDRLTLIGRVLSSTDDAYKHSAVILDLVNKLGFRNDIAAEVKTLAMIADAALQSEDFASAAETIERMIEIVRKLEETPSTSQDAAETTTKKREVVDVCWHSCFQLGRQSEFHDAGKKLKLLGYALEECPPEHMLDVLSVWRKIEGEDIRRRRDVLASRRQDVSTRQHRAKSSATSLRTRLQDLQSRSSTLSTSDAVAAAALAGRTFRSVAANFPFSVRGRTSEERSASSYGAREQGPGGADVSSHAKQAFAKGIGWLIGADE